MIAYVNHCFLREENAVLHVGDLALQRGYAAFLPLTVFFTVKALLRITVGEEHQRWQKETDAAGKITNQFWQPNNHPELSSCGRNQSICIIIP